ncbi:hypothetical protein PoB_005004200 [Plakobranchus ocellatus]|uniref:Uncharacterized protein n=1 Tax=Plakobranchus ocellatus TaxID=259542 RepID=A0AAV4BWT8_9GAST|nr:hypothetical protein PoB_005004200 [Plakobranchus ocellatus]
MVSFIQAVEGRKKICREMEKYGYFVCVLKFTNVQCLKLASQVNIVAAFSSTALLNPSVCEVGIFDETPLKSGPEITFMTALDPMASKAGEGIRNNGKRKKKGEGECENERMERKKA